MRIETGMTSRRGKNQEEFIRRIRSWGQKTEETKRSPREKKKHWRGKSWSHDLLQIFSAMWREKRYRVVEEG